LNLNRSGRSLRIEQRWPAALAILFMALLVVGMPNRFRLFPVLWNYVLLAAALVPMLAVGLTGGRPPWLRIERRALWLFVVTIVAMTLGNLWILIKYMVAGGGKLSAIELLASGVAIWVTIVVVFSLAFWHVDRGGPEARLNHLPIRADWLFPQEGVPDFVRPGWRPTFIDYLFLAFSTATAFSPTGAVPLTARSMLLMMLQSAMSLVTIAVIAARAINILGS
jgi:hypothetical protein